MIRNLSIGLVVKIPYFRITSQRVRYFGATVSTLSKQKHLSHAIEPFRTHCAEQGFVWTSGFGQIAIQNLTVDQYVWKNMAKWQNKIAIVCGVTGRQYSYSELRDHSSAVAHRLQKHFNLSTGDVVAISMPNVPEFAIVALGALEAGLTITTINPNFTPG